MSFREGIPDIIITFAATDVKTKWAKDRIIDGWAELITSSDPKIAEFAKDLVTYSFFTSGFKKSVYSIFHFIPPAYLKEIGFSRYMKNMRNEFNETTNYGLLESVHDDVFQNLWSEEDIVPFVDFKDLGQVRRPSAKLNWGEKYPQQISISNAPGVGSELSAADKLLLGYNEHMEGIYKPFIKIESDNIFYLYKFVGYNIKEDGSTEPVYVITKKKGFYEAGKVVKEHGLPKSVIDENESRDLPETFNYAAVGYKADEQGNVTKKTYDFSGFHRIEPQYLKVVTPVEEETWGDFDLEEGELLEDYNQTTGLPVGTTVSGINISSYESGLGRDLSNFAKMTVEFEGKTYKSSEEAYQDKKSEISPLTNENVLPLMTSIIKAKLEQHPELIKEITDNGGLNFLNESTHDLIKDGKHVKKDRWTGKNGLFMRALRDAYSQVSTVESSNSSLEGVTKDKIEELKKKYKPCKGV